LLKPWSLAVLDCHGHSIITHGIEGNSHSAERYARRVAVVQSKGWRSKVWGGAEVGVGQGEIHGRCDRECASSRGTDPPHPLEEFDYDGFMQVLERF
jgi:hypothetical protein